MTKFPFVKGKTVKIYSDIEMILDRQQTIKMIVDNCGGDISMFDNMSDEEVAATMLQAIEYGHIHEILEPTIIAQEIITSSDEKWDRETYLTILKDAD